MPMEHSGWVILVETTGKFTCAVYVIPATREECERLRKRGIKVTQP